MRSLLSPSVRLSVCLSLCPSVRPSLCHVGALYPDGEDIVKLPSRPGSSIILVFFLIPSAGNQFQGNPFSSGAKYTEGGKLLRLSTEIAVYLGNGIRDRPMVTMER